MKKVISNKKRNLEQLKTEWPKYTASLMNLSNSIGNKTAKKKIGPLHEYFQEYENECKSGKFERSIDGWRKFYLYEKNGTERIQKVIHDNLITINFLKEALEKINEKMISDYIDDLVFKKTFLGMDYEGMSARVFANYLGIDKNNFLTKVKKSNYEDESKGIDYWVNEIPIQIKPYDSFKANKQNIISNGLIIYYSIINDEFQILFDDKNKFLDFHGGIKDENNA